MAVTARIGGTEAVGPPDGMEWVIEYDDQSRAVTATAEGTGHCLVTVQITSGTTRTVAFVQPGRTWSADFMVTTGTGAQTVASNVNANQVTRLIGKPGSLGGLLCTAEWGRF